MSALPFYEPPVRKANSLTVGETYYSREVRGRDALVEDVIEANVLEEGMPFYLFRVAFP